MTEKLTVNIADSEREKMSGSLTVNIESTDLRFMVSDGRKIKLWGSIPLEPGIVKEGLALNPQALSTIIGELIASKHLKKGKVIVSLSGIQSVHRTIDLPKLSNKLLGQAIMVEAKKAMPISLEQIYLSWNSLSEKKDGVQRFFLLGVPKNMLDAEVWCLRQAGINPGAMTLKPMALARMVNRAGALIIDIEPETCTITVIAGGIPTIIRSVAMNPGHSSLERAQYVLQEFERTLQFHKSTYPNDPLSQETPLFLTGLMADNDELSKAIAAGVSYKVEPLTSPLKYPSDFPLAQFAVNIGLALNGASRAAKQAAYDGRFLIRDLNILPDIYRPKSISTKQILTVAGIVVGVALMFPLYQAVDSAAGDASAARAENDRLKQEISIRQVQNTQASNQANEIKQQIEKINQEIAAIDSEIKAAPNIGNTIKELSDQRQHVYDAMCKAIALLPANITLSSISYSAGGLSLPGEAVIRNGTEEVRTSFGISLKIKDESIAEEVSGDINQGWLIGNDPDYEGYKVVLGYANALRNETDWFSNVQLHSMSVSQSSPTGANGSAVGSTGSSNTNNEGGSSSGGSTGGGSTGGIL